MQIHTCFLFFPVPQPDLLNFEPQLCKKLCRRKHTHAYKHSSQFWSTGASTSWTTPVPCRLRFAAIDPVFTCSKIIDPNGKTNYPYYWTSTTHLDGPVPYGSAVYIAFGEALGKMKGRNMDVHGAGAQRSNPNAGNAADYPKYMEAAGRYADGLLRCKLRKKYNTPGKQLTFCPPRPPSHFN